MIEVYENLINEMIELHKKIEKDFKWENSLSRHFAALTYALKERCYDPEKIKITQKRFKEQTNIFSYYRGNSLFTISMLLCSEFLKPEDQVKILMINDNKLKAAGFRRSTYLPIANYALLITCEKVSVDERIHKAYEIYQKIKKNHPWITSGDDYPLCILLANSKEEEVVERVEKIYTLLNTEGFSKGNGLQLLSHILTFSNEEDYIITKRCRDIYNQLKDNKFNVYSSYYAALGLITLLYENKRKIVEDIVDIATYLKIQKKYKWLGKGMNILMASAIASMEFIENKDDLIDTTVSISVEALIAAQTSAIVAGMAASTAAVSATS